MGSLSKKRFEKKGTNRQWSIFCIARYGGHIKWYRRNPYSFINIARKVKSCMKSDRICRYSIKQTVWPGKETLYVSELHIKSLKIIDFGAYTCRMSNLHSAPFKLVRERGRAVSLTPFYQR
ncbi:hypothetical protein ElyMa_001315400 [Elysia marginata]|uniref:Ig-like domain-containing protein n=1 Tax=Elysia marginata TaxID=1093978 RepID=A0AAV4ILI9_9GAST|nr:hypothetical protein ElyMa_001315400 [Elysia marginata]